MSKTEHRISYKAGITRRPSDFFCEDGELAECINLTTDNEELKVVSQPELFMTVGGVAFILLYVHTVNGVAHFIGYEHNGSEYRIRWGVRGNDRALSLHSGYMTTVSTPDTLQITSIGNFLILSDGTTMSYFLWKTDTGDYVYQSNKIPEPKMEFAMVYGNWGTANRSGLNGYCSGEVGDCLDFQTMAGGAYVYRQPIVKDKGKYNDLVVGLYAQSLKFIAEKKCFAKPFLVRYALELYDGSYANISDPIVMLPAVTCNCYAQYFDKEVTLNVYGYQLAFKSQFDYSEWSDIVKGVVVFVSDGINLYDLGNDQEPRPGYTNGSNSADGVEFSNGITATASSGMNMSTRKITSTFTEHSSKYFSGKTNADSSLANNGFVYFLPLNQRSSSDILDDLTSTSVFYKLFDSGIKGNGKWESTKGYIKSHILENITTQEQLSNVGDYFSRCPLIPEFMMSYNSRLMLAGIKRGFFEGFDTFLPYDNEKEYTYDVYVYIKTPSGIRVIKKQLSTYEKVGIYFFYPDTRAHRAVVFNGSTLVCDMELKEHPCLNGAYYFDVLPDGTEGEPTTSAGSSPTKSECENALNSSPEQLENQIYQSEVNNPYVFTYKGNKTIGTGKILSLATLTTALSQGQFGQHPVIVFTTEGIWAMAVDNEGYMQPAQPMSREVCINAKTVLETDGAVFFASKKGLMVVVGNQVKCMTEQMNGVTCNTDTIGDPVGADTDWRNIISKCSGSDSFLQYIRDENCFLAYDYIDSRILIINPSYQFSYLYSIADGNVSKVTMPSSIIRAVNYYPDYLLQDKDYTVYSLYSKKDETEIGERQLAFLLTRPMKLTGPLNVSSLRELINVGYWDKKAGSSVKTEVFVSDNLVDWYDMESRFGAAAKYFRIALYINIYPTERLSGTIIRDQERRSNNAR